MTCSNWLIQASAFLEASGIETARLDALVLLEDCLAKDRSWLLAHPETKLSTVQEATLKKLLKRRANHEPLAYVRGQCEFYNYQFVLTPAVLQPRPESETFIDLVKALVNDGSLRPKGPSGLQIADVGTGSGAIGITLALEIPNCQVELLEVDPKAAVVAKINVDKFTLNISVTISNLLEGSNRAFDALVCNLPYVPDDFQINRAALHEPPIAIFGGPDGLDVYRQLFNQVRKRTSKPLFILTEALPPQHKDLQAIAQEVDYRLLKTDDFIQVFQYAVQ